MSRGGGAGSGQFGRIILAGIVLVLAATEARAQPPPPLTAARSQERSVETPAPIQPSDPRLTLDSVAVPSLPDSVTAAASYVERDSVRVVYWGDSAGLAELTLTAALNPIPLPGITGAALLPRATIYLPPDRATFDALTFGGTPDWAAGVAIPAALIIVIPPGRANVGSGDPAVTLRHEIAHLALHRHLGGRVPRWFDEGSATWVSGGWDESTGWMIRMALLRGTAEPLDSLTLGWPRGEARARLAYLLSASAVRHLATSRGDEAFAAFIAEWRRVGSLEPALRTVYQITLYQFEREWREMVKRRYGWLLAMSQVGAFWLVIAIAVFMLGTLRRQRNREKLADMRREEYMLPAEISETYDGVDPDLPRI